MDTDPDVIGLTEVVVTVRPEETVSMIFPAESIELTVKELEVPQYLVFQQAGMLRITVDNAFKLARAKKPLKVMVVDVEVQSGLAEED